MFDSLSDRLQRVFKELRGEGTLTEFHVDEALKEIRTALLEADVSLPVVKDFVARVREKAVGTEVLTSLSPAQQVVKIVRDELTRILGGAAAPLVLKKRPAVILLVGLQGSGKTTTAAKLALHLKKGSGKHVFLVPADVHRPAATEQLRTLARENGLMAFDPKGETSALARVSKAVKDARIFGYDAAILDTAGRLHVDEALMDEVAEIAKATQPDEILFVADAMTGQEAVRIAEGFDQALDLSGVVLTKMDGDARGGAALSIRAVTGKPIKFIGLGEGLDELDAADPQRMAGRILQMGDVVGLVERAERAIDAKESAKLQEKVLGKGKFSLEDFLTAMRQVQRMGPLEQLLKLIPGASRMKLPVGQMDPKRMKHVEAIILSMTPQERQTPKIINSSRKVRIAKGSGRPIQEVNRLLKQFEEMQKMMKQMKGMIPRGMGGGGGMGFPF